MNNQEREVVGGGGDPPSPSPSCPWRTSILQRTWQTLTIYWLPLCHKTCHMMMSQYVMWHVMWCHMRCSRVLGLRESHWALYWRVNSCNLDIITWNESQKGKSHFVQSEWSNSQELGTRLLYPQKLPAYLSHTLYLSWSISRQVVVPQPLPQLFILHDIETQFW